MSRELVPAPDGRFLPDSRGVYHPRRACAWCGHEPSPDALVLVPQITTHSLALNCRDRRACIRRQLERRLARAA